MLIEKITFNIVAFLFFLLIFYKMLKKNDSSFVIVFFGQAIGISVRFIELMLDKNFGNVVLVMSYFISIIFPIIAIILETKRLNVEEVIYTFLSKAYELFGKDKKAKNILVKLVTRYPESYIGHLLLAKLYEKDGGMRRSIDEYVKAIDIKGNDYDSYYKISELLNELGKKDESVIMLNNLLKIKPEYYKASKLLGSLLCEKQMHKEAVNVYTEALRYKPNDYELYYNIGMSYTLLNDFYNAKISYDKAADINHKLYTAKYYLGKIALIYQDIDLAEKYFTECIYGEEIEVYAYYELAKIYMLKNEKEKAIVFIEKAIELDIQYAKKAENEPIFIPIRAYIKIPKNIEEVHSRNNMLSKKENDVKEHLTSTLEVVGNLSDIDLRKMRKNQLKETEKNREDERYK